MGKDYLGEFEEVVLTLVAALGDQAYGASIADHIENSLKRSVNLSAVHVTLHRLEDKGLVESKMGGGSHERGGRRKRLFTVTNSGMEMLQSIRESRIQLWEMVPELKLS
jgi:PadR family transcriptional regulator PadR